MCCRVLFCVALGAWLLAGCGDDTQGVVDSGPESDGRDAFDAGFDAGWDAGHDAGIDAGEDAGQADAGPDAGADEDQDAGFDAGGDLSPDAGQDAGSPDGGDPPADDAADAGMDAGNDAGQDASDVDPTPAGCIQGEFLPYFGNLHAHTGHSDGAGTPAVAFEYAREQAQLDMMIVTDHLEQLYTILGVPDTDWDECRQAADEANEPGAYLAMCGYEYGSGFSLLQSIGHSNVYFIDTLFPAIQLDYHDFYQSVNECPDCITQFNHPGDDTEINWDDFEYHADVDQKMNLFEFNGSGPVWDLFFLCLDAGWHVAPTYNQDNHDADWGTKNDHRSGFYLADLSREALHQAMKDRRGFMTHDKNATLRLMGNTSCWMGSMLTGYSSLTVEAFADDPDGGDGFVSIEFFGPGQALLASIDCAGLESCQGSHTIPISGPTYLVARSIQTDGDWLVSAPIWVAP